ncbi:MAG: GNAT family N-acetyltransferase, partial [Actinobacteria bacterium]|nr:GNAT family N-acetyltransferase [Actinomycetota bacterium]
MRAASPAQGLARCSIGAAIRRGCRRERRRSTRGWVVKPVRGDDGASRATSGQGALRVVVVEPDQPIFDAVVELANGPAKRTLGFLPTSGFRDRTRKATLIAVLRDDAVIGYVLYDLRPRDIKIVQLCVDPGARRSGAARFLLDAVRAGHPDHHRIVLRCRTDYEEASKV